MHCHCQLTDLGIEALKDATGVELDGAESVTCDVNNESEAVTYAAEKFLERAKAKGATTDADVNILTRDRSLIVCACTQWPGDPEGQ